MNTSKQSAHIVVFDSGLGGLSILQAVQARFPRSRFTYCSDNEAFPYGTQSEQILTDRVAKVLGALDAYCQPDILIIACNTASTLVLPKIRSLIKQPVIGVVPAIKPAASLCQTPRAALLATPATIKRPYTQNLIDQYAAAIQWIKIGSSRLVELAEQKIYTGKIRIDGVKQEVAPLSVFSAEQLDTVVLGCTHFSLIKDELKQVLPQIQYWVDSAEAIAQRTGFWLHESGFIQQERGASDTPNQLLLTRTTKNTVPGFAPEHTSVLPLS